MPSGCATTRGMRRHGPPSNGQRLIALRDIPAATRIGSAQLDGDKVQILFQPENKSVSYQVDWLVNNAYDRKTEIAPGLDPFGD